MNARYCVSRALAVAFTASALLSACGDDEDSPGGVDSGLPGGPDAGADGPVFESPEDFDRSGCEGGVGEVDPEGIWHMAIDFSASTSLRSAAAPQHDSDDPNIVADVLRVDREGDDGLAALLFGRAVDEVVHSDSDLFLRHAYAGSGGREIVRAWTACSVSEEGALFGRYASCRGQDCLVGTFEAYRVEPLDEAVASGIREVAVYGGAGASSWPVDSSDGLITANVRQMDEIAYVVRYADGLRIVDVSDPESPSELGHAPVSDSQSEFYNDVKLVRDGEGGTYAIVASNLRGAVVIDVSDPSNPEEVATFPEPGEDATRVDVHTLFIENARAYLANLSRRGLDVFDVADPRNPDPLGSYVDEGVESGNDYVHDLFISNGRAYLNYWNLGLVIVDASDPANPQRLGAFDDYAPRTSHSNWVTEAGGRLVSVHGGEGYDAHVRIVDVDETSSTFTESIGSYQTRPQVSVHNILAAGELAYVTYYQDGLRVLDLADPSAPQELAHYHTWPGAEPGYGESFFEGAIGVDVDSGRDLIYVADTHRGLVLLALDAEPGAT